MLDFRTRVFGVASATAHRSSVRGTLPYLLPAPPLACSFHHPGRLPRDLVRRVALARKQPARALDHPVGARRHRRLRRAPRDYDAGPPLHGHVLRGDGRVRRERAPPQLASGKREPTDEARDRDRTSNLRRRCRRDRRLACVPARAQRSLLPHAPPRCVLLRRTRRARKLTEHSGDWLRRLRHSYRGIPVGVDAP
jgi:hypothetical protein